MTLTRLSSLVAMFALVLLLVFPAVAAAQSPVGDERGVLFGVRDDLTLDAGSSASVVVAVQGHVTIAGHARVVFMVDGTVELQGTSASVDTLVAVRAHVKLGAGTTVGTLRALDSTIDQDPTATVTDTKDLQGSMVVLVGVLGTFLALLLLGWAIAVLVSGAVLGAVAAKQMRRMAASVSREPLKVLGAGALGFIVLLIIAVLLFVTVIGIPLGVLVLLSMWLAGFVGFLAMGVWLGDAILHRGGTGREGKPIGSAVLGLVLLLLASLIPLVSFFVGWLGFGTVILNAWRAMRGGSDRYQPQVAAAGWPTQPQPGWGAPPGPAGPQPGWGQPPAQPGPPPGWGQPPAQPGPPPGWGQPPDQGR